MGPNVNASSQSWKRCKQEEIAKQGASSSVLMNLLVSGCDVSAGYVCFTSQKPKSTTNQQRSRFYNTQTRQNVAAK